MDVPPLKYLKWGDCIIELKLLCICRIGPSGPVAVNHFGLLQVVGSSVRTFASVWPWRFYLSSSEMDAVVMLFRRQVCRIAALFPSVLPPFRIVERAGGRSCLVDPVRSGSTACGSLSSCFLNSTPSSCEFDGSATLPLPRRLPPCHGVFAPDAVMAFAVVAM